MLFRDLRDFISTIEKLGDLTVVPGANPHLEIGAITEVASFRKKCPAVLFDSLQGFEKGYRILTNFLSYRIREQLVFGVANDLTDPEAVLYWKNKLKEFTPIEPVETQHAPSRRTFCWDPMSTSPVFHGPSGISETADPTSAQPLASLEIPSRNISMSALTGSCCWARTESWRISARVIMAMLSGRNTGPKENPALSPFHLAKSLRCLSQPEPI